MSVGNEYLKEAKKLVPDVLAVFTAVILFALIFALGKVVNSATEIKLADYISALALLSSAVAIAVVVYTHRKAQEFKSSEAFLNESISIINKARAVLADEHGRPTNDRICWVTAARLITRAQDISSRITVPAHRTLFDAEHDYQRHKFGDFLQWNGAPLTAGFFCGTSDPLQSIGQAAFNGPHKDNGTNWLPVRIVAVVYRFFQYPDGYEDPLDASTNFSNREIDKLWLLNHKGLSDYILFRSNFFGVGKGVLRLSTPDKPKAYVTPSEIDSFVSANSGSVI